METNFYFGFLGYVESEDMPCNDTKKEKKRRETKIEGGRYREQVKGKYMMWTKAGVLGMAGETGCDKDLEDL